MILIHGGPPALPGCCYLCGSGSRELYVDLNRDVDYHGAMYICDLCLTQMAHMIGLEDATKSTEVQLKLLAANEKIERLQGELGALKDLKDVMDNIRNYAASSDDIDVSPVEPEQGNYQGEEELADGETELASGEERSPEPIDEQGMDELRTGQSSEFSFGQF